MKPNQRAFFGSGQMCISKHRLSVVAALLGVAFAPNIRAFELQTDNPDTKVRWDTTVKYSTAFRTKSVDPTLVGRAQANLDDGDRNFSETGQVSNRFDIFTEADVSFSREFGARVSAAGWYDSVYFDATKNNSRFTANSASVPFNQFTDATSKLHGQNAEILDAFVFGGGDVGDMHANWRLGKHSVLWGETLFFGANGIAGGQAPIDYVKLLSVPGSQFKEVVRPVNQLSGQLQVNPEITLGSYYQLEWQPNRIPAAGSYFSFSDVLDQGGERLFWPTGSNFKRGEDLKASDSGQYGVRLSFRPKDQDSEYGFYAVRYNQKDFSTYIRPAGAFFGPGNAPGANVGNYVLAYHEGIVAYGGSVSTSVGPANVGAEVSFRQNAPLANAGVFAVSPTANNTDNPLYPVGRTAHVNISSVVLLPPTALWDGGTLLAEVGWNRLLGIDKNPAAIDPNATTDAWGFRLIFAPSYYQVANGVDVTIPIGLGYNPSGKSSAVSLFNGGIDQGGDLSIGVNAEYNKKVRFGVSYTTYLGSSGAFFAPSNDRQSFQQKYADRDFLSFNIQTTF